MAQSRAVYGYVALVCLAALMCGAAAWAVHLPYPGLWPLATFTILALVLESLKTQLRVDAKGSTSFIMHMAVGLMFGGFWGAVVAAVSTLISEFAKGNPPVRLVFNVSQRVLIVSAAALVYQAAGGNLPPAYLLPGSSISSLAIQRDLGLFFLFAATYFSLNSAAVSGVVALNTNRTFREVWHLNTRGVLGYDLSASVLAVAVAWLYSYFSFRWGFGSAGVIVVIVPIVAVRHVYGLYHRLQDSGQELLQVMVKAIEARDPYTSGHSLRVSALSRTIALELGLPTRDVEQIETAALLHDVGKIHEEFAPLLRKESRLTPEETALMQTHSTKSADLVGIISKFRGFVQESVRHHHERWDGQGYPSGLAGKLIPLGSRIILISDTIDAMTTDRPYRKRLSVDIVVAELQKCRGTQFDPEIIDVVISSVAARRLIAESSYANVDQDMFPTRSRRVAWPRAPLWRTGR